MLGLGLAISRASQEQQQEFSGQTQREKILNEDGTAIELEDGSGDIENEQSLP